MMVVCLSIYVLIQPALLVGESDSLEATCHRPQKGEVPAYQPTTKGASRV